jgi:hypothetical protein
MGSHSKSVVPVLLLEPTVLGEDRHGGHLKHLLDLEIPRRKKV